MLLDFKTNKVVGFGGGVFAVVFCLFFFLETSQFEECGKEVQKSAVAISLLKAQKKFRCTNMIQFLLNCSVLNY